VSDFVAVFETGDPALVALASSLLDSAGIEFAKKGEGLQDLFGVGRFPGGTNLVTGPVVFQVGPNDAEKARSLLRDLK
jgi:putative signal transducing protein